MNRILPCLIYLCSLWSQSLSNPKIDPYYRLGITEVYIAGPGEWSIELDGNWCLFDINKQRLLGSLEFPCTTHVYLSIKPNSAPENIYRAKVGFAENGYGVVNRASLTELPPGRTVRLDAGALIKVAQKAEHLSAPSGNPVRYWSFPVKDCEKGKSLIAVKDKGYNRFIYETSRISLGQPGNYSTNYQIQLFNKYGGTLSQLRVVGPGINSETDSYGFFSMSISILEPETVIKFFDKLTAHPMVEIQIATLPIRYDDKSEIVQKPIKLPVTQYMLTVEDADNRPVFPISCFKEIQPSGYSRLELWESAGNDVFTLPLRIYPSRPVSNLCFTLNRTSPENCIKNWSGVYIDTAATIKKTITINTVPISPSKEIQAFQSAVKLHALRGNSREIRMVVSSPLPLARGSISLLAFNGKEIKSLQVRMRGPGTSSALFRFPKRKLTPGTYVCRLALDGHAPVSQQITIP